MIANPATLCFDVTPVAKPRMTRRDKWAKREIVTNYWAYKDELTLLANKYGYRIGGELNATFYLPMPQSWSKKKRIEMNGKPHLNTPDTDNLTKGFMDALLAKDSAVWHTDIRKYWAERGQILITR